MPTLFSEVVCLTCGHRMLPDPMLAKCERCGSAWLDARYHYGEVRWANGLARRPLSLWRYEELLPLSDSSQRVSISEGMTPIIRAERLGETLGHAHILIKDERRMPTNSFKDRQGALSVSIFEAGGHQRVRPRLDGQRGGSVRGILRASGHQAVGLSAQHGPRRENARAGLVRR